MIKYSGKPHTLPVLFIIILSIVSGYLMSKATLVGRVGMSLFYREYNFLKVWWKGALVVFAVLAILYFTQGWLQKKWDAQNGRAVHIIAIAISLTGLYFTYTDFRHTFSHRLLGERFHLGFYLSWLDWLAISVFYLWKITTRKAEGKNRERPS